MPAGDAVALETSVENSVSDTRKDTPPIPAPTTVVNLSQCPLSSDEVQLWSRGLSFCPTPPHLNSTRGRWKKIAPTATKSGCWCNFFFTAPLLHTGADRSWKIQPKAPPQRILRWQGGRWCKTFQAPKSFDAAEGTRWGVGSLHLTSTNGCGAEPGDPQEIQS